MVEEMRGRTNWGNILDAPDDYADETDLGFERPADTDDTYLAPQEGEGIAMFTGAPSEVQILGLYFPPLFVAIVAGLVCATLVSQAAQPERPEPLLLASAAGQCRPVAAGNSTHRLLHHHTLNHDNNRPRHHEEHYS